MKTIYITVILSLLSFTWNMANAQCKANFSFTVNKTDSSVVTFIDASTGSITNGYWYVDDGSSIRWTTSAYTHKFAKSGTYTVCRYVEDSTRTCYDSICKSITVKFTAKSCAANFTETVKSDTASFTSTGSKATDYYWTFGDGSSAWGKNQTHIYNIPKNTVKVFQVCLLTYDSASNCSDSICRYITFYKQDSCVANFTYTGRNDTISFNNTSKGFGSGSTTWVWSFGDGTTSTAKNPTHIYSGSGAYTVCLVLYDSISGCRTSHCDSVMVTKGSSKCAAKFNYYTYNLTATFVNASSGSTSTAWTFGDGTSSTSSNNTHTYAKPGTYTVCLKITGSGCVDSICKTVVVDTQHCKAAFRLDLDTTTKFKAYIYNSSSNLGSHLYQWSFGDGNYSTKRNPSHQYSTFGRYLVCLVVTDTFYGCSSTFCDTVGMDSTGKRLKAGFSLEVIEEGNASVKKLNTQQVSIYPNPVIDKLHFKMDESNQFVEVKVFSLNGVEVLHQTVNLVDQSSVDVEALQSGLYILQLNNGESVSTHRFIKSE